jgi:hypothetical protein
MELEDLKSIWKNSEPAFQPKNEQEIALMLKGKSVSIINKLKRNVWFELGIAILASIGLLIYALSLETGALKWTSISLLLMCLAYSIIYVKKLLLLNRFQALDGNLRETISLLVENLTSYLKFYKNSYAILYPVYFMLGILFSVIERGPEEYLEYLSKTGTLLYTLVVAGAFAGVFFFVSTMGANWYLKKLYGNHLEKLKGILNELRQ